jgi:hypothetical protein
LFSRNTVLGPPVESNNVMSLHCASGIATRQALHGVESREVRLDKTRGLGREARKYQDK